MVIACLALFVALGGTVMAATKIDGKTIRVKSLPGNRLKVGSVPGNRIAPHSLNGSQIKAETLAEVPDAAHADAADTARRAQTATAADHATDASTINGHTVGCAAGRRQYAGACWDLRPSTVALNAIEAAATCAAQGGILPDLLQLIAFDQQPGAVPEVGGEWTTSVQPTGIDSWALVVVENGSHTLARAPTIPYHFRCVTPLLN
jgi:hypothetical protein